MSQDHPGLVLEVRHLVKHFPIRPSFLDALRRQPPGQIRAVDDVSFTLARGEVMALVGESGCGKTTIARTLIGLEQQTSGQILFSGELVGALQRRARAGLLSVDPGRVGTREQQMLPHMSLKRLRQRAQMIFQDPYESLNPRATVFDIVAEPLLVHGVARGREHRLKRVVTALEDAGLRPARDFFLRFPHELSGGQRQRVVIAGAMVLNPALLVADEPVSSLDASVRGEILKLMLELVRDVGVTILVVTHDLGLAWNIADRIAVMYLGRIVEEGPAEELLSNPRHPYTRALLSVVPEVEEMEQQILQGEAPDPTRIPPGCRFHPRCPLVASGEAARLGIEERCRTEDLVLRDVAAEHGAACHAL